MFRASRRALFGAVLGCVADLALANARSAQAVPDPSPADHRWRRHGDARALPVIDCTGPLWSEPVRAAAEIWNQALPNFRFNVEEGSPSGPTAVEGAIVIRSPHLDAPWNGLTTPTIYRNGDLRTITITLDDANYTDRYPWPQTSARGTLVGHELGHALGLTHAPAGTGGWMAVDRLEQGNPLGPGWWMIEQFERTYGIASDPATSDREHRGGRKRKRRRRK